MLAQRADFLLRTGLCRYPKRILAISFKVDASRNLKERVKRRCGASLSARFDSYTFHAFAKRIIDRFRPVLSGRDALDADYTIGEPRVTRRQIGFGDLAMIHDEICLFPVSSIGCYQPFPCSNKSMGLFYFYQNHYQDDLLNKLIMCHKLVGFKINKSDHLTSIRSHTQNGLD